jgi:hypothetical protein
LFGQKNPSLLLIHYLEYFFYCGFKFAEVFKFKVFCKFADIQFYSAYTVNVRSFILHILSMRTVSFVYCEKMLSTNLFQDLPVPISMYYANTYLQLCNCTQFLIVIFHEYADSFSVFGKGTVIHPVTLKEIFSSAAVKGHCVEI